MQSCSDDRQKDQRSWASHPRSANNVCLQTGAGVATEKVSRDDGSDGADAVDRRAV